MSQPDALPARLVDLLAADAGAAAARNALLHAPGWVDADVALLKDHSATFYAADPERAHAIAALAAELGATLSPTAAAVGLWALANAHVLLDRYEEALHGFAAAAAHLRAAGRADDLARMAVGQVGAHAYAGQPEAGLALAGTAGPRLAALAQASPADARRYISLLLNVATCHELCGQFNETLAVTAQMIEAAVALDDRWLEAQGRHNRGLVLLQLNLREPAYAEMALAAEAMAADGAWADLLRLRMNVAQFAAAAGDAPQSDAALAAARTLLRVHPTLHDQQPMYVRVRVASALALARPVGPSLQRALRLAAQEFDRRGARYEAAIAWLQLGNSALRGGRIRAAAHALHAAEAAIAQGAGRGLQPALLYARAGLARSRHAPQAALTLLTEAVAAVEKLRSPLATDSVRSAYLVDKLEIYYARAALYGELGDLRRAAAAADRAHGRLLLEQRHALQLAAATSMADPALAAAASRLQALYHRAALGARGLAEPLADADLAATAAAERQVQELSSRRVHFHSDDPAPPLDAPLDLGLLSTRPGTVAIVFAAPAGRYEAYVVGAEGARACAQLDFVPAVATLAADLQRSLDRALDLGARLGHARAAHMLGPLLADSRRHLARLHESLVAPWLAHVAAGERLLLAPCPALFALPLHAAWDGARYLVDRHSVGYTPALHLLAARSAGRSTAPPAQGAPLLMGYAGAPSAADAQHPLLPRVDAEIAALAQLLPRAAVYTGHAATWRALRENAAQAPLIHLAAHGRFRRDLPMLSSLLLADHTLTLVEVAQLPLHDALVTLSGCETGQGANAGADVIGLAAAFLGAGARALLVSRWRADDGLTAALMQHVYAALVAGRPAADALADAQRALAAGAQAGALPAVAAHPAYWAPFMLLGDPAARL